MVGPTERCGCRHDVLAWIPASNGLRDGSDLGLIPDVVLMMSRVEDYVSGSSAKDRLGEERYRCSLSSLLRI